MHTQLVLRYINTCGYFECWNQDYKSRHDWVREVFHWELCKRLKFDHEQVTVKTSQTQVRHCKNKIGLIVHPSKEFCLLLRSLPLEGGVLVVVMVKALDCGIVVSEFKFQSHYYVRFRTNTLGKGMNPLIAPAIDEIVQLLFF